jgi:hypothetical protein
LAAPRSKLGVEVHGANEYLIDQFLRDGRRYGRRPGSTL